MHRHDIGRIDRGELRNGPLGLLLRPWTDKMEAAYDRVDLLDARNLLRMAHRIDHAAMAAGCDYDKAEISNHVKGRELMFAIIG